MVGAVRGSLPGPAVFLAGALLVMVSFPASRAEEDAGYDVIPFNDVKLIIEVNATDGHGGLQALLDGEDRLAGMATLSHVIPAGPEILRPGEADRLPPGKPVVIEWDQVVDNYEGSSAVDLVGYRIIVEKADDPLRVLSAELPGSATTMTVPEEFLETGTEYRFEVLAVEAGGNETRAERAFSILP